MKPDMLYRMLLIAGVLVAPKSSGETSSSSATLPLDDLLKLHQELESAQKHPAQPAPIAASVDKLELSGRLFDEGIELRAHFDVSVLSNSGWTTLPLLRLDAH